jgi:hypothetical protein
MSEWQLIETAPKDGTLIILFPNWRIAWWESGDEQWMYDAVSVEFDNGRPVINENSRKGFYCRYAKDPTHWMPLPEPPDNCQNRQFAFL